MTSADCESRTFQLQTFARDKSIALGITRAQKGQQISSARSYRGRLDDPSALSDDNERPQPSGEDRRNEEHGGRQPVAEPSQTDRCPRQSQTGVESRDEAVAVARDHQALIEMAPMGSENILPTEQTSPKSER